MKTTRKDFLKTLGVASATVLSGNALASAVSRASEKKSLPASQAAHITRKADKIKLGVSLYSYQHAIYTGDMTTEDCLAELNAIGAEGVQIIDGITIPNFPNPPQSWVDQWLDWMEKYKLTPTLMDTFVDVYRGYRRPAMSFQEQHEKIIRQCKLAKRLGFGMIRPIITNFAELDKVFTEVVPAVEDLNMKIAAEIHSPFPLKGSYVNSMMDIITKTGTKNLGFTFDFGVVGHRYYSPLTRDESIRNGWLTKDIAIYAEQARENGESLEKVKSKVKKMNPKPGDVFFTDLVYDVLPLEGPQQDMATLFKLVKEGPQYAMLASMIMGGGGVPRNNPQDLKPLIPYLFNCHGKFYQMSEDLEETQIEYPATVKVLMENDWEGFIDSEYEGQQHLHNQWCEPINEAEQVRRHHVMLRKLLGKS